MRFDDTDAFRYFFLSISSPINYKLEKLRDYVRYKTIYDRLEERGARNVNYNL